MSTPITKTLLKDLLENHRRFIWRYAFRDEEFYTTVDRDRIIVGSSFFSYKFISKGYRRRGFRITKKVMKEAWDKFKNDNPYNNGFLSFIQDDVHRLDIAHWGGRSTCEAMLVIYAAYLFDPEFFTQCGMKLIEKE